MKNKWQLQDAKAKFSQVVSEAGINGPQYITKHGKDAAVIVSMEDYKALTERRGKLSAFFQDSPLYGLEFERDKDTDREIEL